MLERVLEENKGKVGEKEKEIKVITSFFVAFGFSLIH
jgi:hypothetical protein